jgi:predicted Zn-dependent protease
MRRIVSLCLFSLLAGALVAGGAAQADKLRDKLVQKLHESKRLLLAVSEEDEIRVGREVAASLLGVAPLVPDEGLQRYVNTVGRWIAMQSERPDLPWHFGVIESADVNAFAAPGGYILLTRGLYANLADESELAGVLAHEIAHVLRRHHIELMRQSLLIAEGGKLIERRLRADKDALVKNLVGNGAEMLARRLDREAEFEADRMAVVLAARAGYDPYGLPAVLQRIAAAARDDDRLRLLFSTHPPPADRLAQLAAAMGVRLVPFENPGAGGRLHPLR